MAFPPPFNGRSTSNPEVYGLEELLLLAGQRLGEEVTSRTVRLYATQGLIDRPGRDGRSAVYGHRHLLQLLLIRSLAQRGLSLSAIAPLCVLPDAELEQQLASLDGPGPEGPIAGATSPSGRSTASKANPALDYIRGLSAAKSSRSPSDDSQALLPLLGTPLSAASPPSLSRSSSRSSGSREAASRWHRLTLAPGVELHISEAVAIPPAGIRRQQWLQSLADRLNEQLDQKSS
ncbi:MerR family transcriptional regulator [Synechococcus sp. CS-205]|uniref:MerR family transcriptional regulator n=1 Tax=Synechococcus sp. CS-205 TaxID=2847984 RepID=UPI00223B53F3|nr:MerR family transcriptional regulator [Synechococcus sp. CS-205]MCT0249055.1 MerR family transcriptional regulator [Synechococcus sp. CS-205]